jgi:hypothetical protein
MNAEPGTESTMNQKQWQNGEFVSAFAPAVSTVPLALPSWPTQEQQQQDFHWTRKHARPRAGDCETWLLEGRQAQWDEAEAQRLSYEEGRRERQQARETNAQAVKAAHRAAYAQRQEADMQRRVLADGTPVTSLIGRHEMLT